MATLAAVTLMGVIGISGRRSYGQPDKKEPSPIGRYQIIPDKDKEGLFFVLDTTTGQTWGYTFRDAFGYRWVNYGTPGHPPRDPEATERPPGVGR